MCFDEPTYLFLGGEAAALAPTVVPNLDPDRRLAFGFAVADVEPESGFGAPAGELLEV